LGIESLLVERGWLAVVKERISINERFRSISIILALSDIKRYDENTNAQNKRFE
jgi:hypothetical protein